MLCIYVLYLDTFLKAILDSLSLMSVPRSVAICVIEPVFNTTFIGSGGWLLDSSSSLPQVCVSRGPQAAATHHPFQRVIASRSDYHYLQLIKVVFWYRAAENGLSLSLMERVIELYQDDVTTMLTVQYRCDQLLIILNFHYASVRVCVSLCVCRLLQLFNDKSSASKSF